MALATPPLNHSILHRAVGRGEREQGRNGRERKGEREGEETHAHTHTHTNTHTQ